MDSPPVPGNLAFVGPSHIRELSEFQYVELASIEEPSAIVKLVGPDYTDDSDDERRLSLSLERFRSRIVSPHERELWPGSFVAHPVAFVRASKEGVDEWAYGAVAGYSMTGLTPTLHLVCHDGAVRLPLSTDTPIIKVDVLNYALQTGGRTNPIALSPTELLAEQNSVVVSCQRRRSGLPDAVKNSLSIPLDGTEIIPLIRPNNLQLVRVRRQHIVDFKVAARSRRPADLYIDPLVKQDRANADTIATTNATPSSKKHRRSRFDDEANSDPGNNPDYVSDGSSNAHSSDDEDVQSIRHLHRPLTKKRRIEYTTFESDSDSDSSTEAIDNDRRSNQGVVFHPSTTERRIHKAVVRRCHSGKEPQLLLQTAQQSSCLEFIGTPPVLRSAWHFGFGVGLSIMHFSRATPSDEVKSTEQGVNMWDFSSRNSLPVPPKATKYSDIIGALSTFYQFSKFFYNKDTRRFIAAARDFVISYSNSAPADPSMARLLTHWVNCKFGAFRSRVVSKGIKSALRVRKQFTRNDEQLIALKDSIPAWHKESTSQSRVTNVSTPGKAQRQLDQRKPKIPSGVIASLPKGEDGRKLCLRYVSQAGCTSAECVRAHFKPDSLTDETKVVIAQRWKGLSDDCKDL